MSKIHSMRQMRREGSGISEIAKTLEVSRNTVYKYLNEVDLSPKMPVKESRTSILDPYKNLIVSWLEEDRRTWKKQRHTAKRIWERLVDEEGLKVSESTVRHYVCRLKKELRFPKEEFLDLVWAPGEAQADFGEADFYGRRLSYFVLTFPFSNVGLAQVFPSENGECVCQALKNIFEFVGGVPLRIVFDNATGVGRRICGVVRTAKTFASFAAHYGFSYSFCNPDSGHEKGNVENKVGFIRRELFVPVRQMDNVRIFNKHLLDKCMALSDKSHWIKGEDESALFMEDRFALAGLPATPFEVVKWQRRTADKYGKVRLDGCHLYSSDPSYAGEELICGLGATEVTIADATGTLICKHRRAYGQAPTDTTDPASQLALLARKPGGWQNSRVREALSNDLRAYMDRLDREALKGSLRIMREVAATSGWPAMIEALERAFAATGRIDSASVEVAASGMASAGIDYDEAVDLSIYDRAIALEEVVL